MKKIKYIPQFTQTECALSCAAMIADYYGHHISLKALRDDLQPGRDGITAVQLLQLFERLGFSCKIYRCERAQLTELQLPVVAYWDKSHYVVIERIKKNHIYIVDPSIGRMICTASEFDKLFSNLIFAPKPADNFCKKKAEKSEWWKYLFLFAQNKYGILAVILLSLVAYAASLLVPYIAQNLVDGSMFAQKQIAVLGIVIILGYGLAYTGSSLISVFVKTDIYKKFYRIVMKKLSDAEYRYYETRNVGSISYNIDCADTINEQFSAMIVAILISGGATVFLSCYIAFSFFPLFLELLALLLLVYFTLYAVNRWIVQLGQLEIAGKSELRGKQYEFISAIENMKIAGIEDRFYKTWDQSFTSAVAKNRAINKAQAIYNSLSAVFSLVIPLAVLLISFSYTFRGRITAGQAISFYSLSTIITSFALTFFSSVNGFKQIQNYLVRLSDAVGVQPEETGSLFLHDVQSIELRDVSFQYDKNAPMILKNLTMKFEKGKKTAIVGASGCGKSTVASLLVKLYKPVSGEILYNGIPAEQFESRHLRHVICCVPQDGALFNRTIKENITLFSKDYAEDEILEACREAEIYDDLMKMPMKLETPLSDIGSNISGGQKQRIFLARALLTKPEFLVLDEATSSLDSKTEQSIYDTLKKQKRSQIVIAHRLSTITDADHIYVLKDGQIAEEGTHEQLMQRGGEYYCVSDACGYGNAGL